jgi:hypothetical protein
MGLDSLHSDSAVASAVDGLATVSSCRQALPHRFTLQIRAASITLNETSVLLYMITEWFDWMKPMPPMSAARLNTWSQPSTT